MSHYQERMIGLLPDSYLKDKSSNNYKLFNCISPEYDLIQQTCKELAKSLDIDYAYGKTLDKLGRNVNQLRGATSDIVFRTLIKAKIAADMSEGTINTLLDVVGFMLGDASGSSQIVELFNKVGMEEEAAFQIVAPMESITGLGVSLGQFVLLMTNIKAAGVRVVADLQGTFELGEVNEYGLEHEAGFADIDQVEGGTLGMLYDPNEDDPLPI